jgi:hypothetical protein
MAETARVLDAEFRPADFTGIDHPSAHHPKVVGSYREFIQIG